MQLIKIHLLEEQIECIKVELNSEDNQADYVKLTELQNKLDNLESQLETVIEEWDRLSTELAELPT